ncbi:MAG: hypothetical protein A3H93_08810 [Rhodocyclales bacterium RIFCSPLOWO2_02_FULL_63_24]|nr:MAG: hypothetical protein A2040_17630 [Rhodocyclales bacterium GWA2_65_19]OHC72487.1 MAG: hypothetical protein A3H93_08810 [Rhodocyclales bacterium RIFCSPLOWO2_02_FULL_63_24]
MPENPLNRLDFNEAVVFVKQRKKAAFAAMPVFGDDNDENAQAEGARIFLLLPDEDEGWTLRFIAGPFFSAAYAANDIIPADEIPDRVRELLFVPTRCEEDWLTDQLQVLLAKLTQAAGIGEQMPDYESQAAKGAGPEAVFPVSFIGLNKPL